MFFQKIHILSIMALKADTFPPDGSFAVINCAERASRYLSVCPPERLLTLDFDDLESAYDHRSFSEENGDAIRRFLLSMPATVTDLFIFCDAGESRSPAIAAGVLLWTGQNDGAIWDNPYYHPNTLVFGRLCRALGVKMTAEEIDKRKQRNENAFRNAITNGTAHKRWEIIICPRP